MSTSLSQGSSPPEGLLRFSDLKYLLDNRAGPIFDDADGNTVITVANRTAGVEAVDGDSSFVTFEECYEDIAYDDLMADVLVNDGENTSEIDYREETHQYNRLDTGRIVSISEPGLWRLGGGVVEEAEDNSSERVYLEQTGVGGLQAGLETYSDDRGDSTPVGSYSGEQNWSMYLQAPDIYCQILERNQK